jgi:ubiquinone/menaquinone biosynthesis C-methylase UbiE
VRWQPSLISKNNTLLESSTFLSFSFSFALKHFTTMTESQTIRKLADDQVETFDKEYIHGELKTVWKRHCDERFSANESFTILDVGGGNGKFIDSMLAEYPNAKGTVLDNAETLLAKNTEHPNKRLVRGSAEDIETLFPDERFDLITFHWVLHHFVIGNYRDTKEMVERVLSACSNRLSENGRVSVFENMYDGWMFTDLPGRIIYTLSSAAWLAPITRRFGANTGGVGVCFRSWREWDRMLSECGLAKLSYADGQVFRKSAMRRYVLHMGNVRSGHFWLGSGR